MSCLALKSLPFTRMSKVCCVLIPAWSSLKLVWKCKKMPVTLLFLTFNKKHDKTFPSPKEKTQMWHYKLGLFHIMDYSFYRYWLEIADCNESKKEKNKWNFERKRLERVCYFQMLTAGNVLRDETLRAELLGWTGRKNVILGRWVITRSLGWWLSYKDLSTLSGTEFRRREDKHERALCHCFP